MGPTKFCCALRKAEPAPAPLPTYPSTGTVKPPVPYKPVPSSGGTMVATNGNSNICSADGWIMAMTGDVAVGHQCTPGQPFSSSTSGNGGGGSFSSGSGSSGSSGADSGGEFQTTAGLNDCISVQYTKSGVLEFVSRCTQSATVLFFTEDTGMSKTEFVDPGKVDNTCSLASST